MIVDDGRKVPASGLVDLQPCFEDRYWGFLSTPSADMGVLVASSPQPYVALCPPLRVAGDADSFLKACLEHADGAEDDDGEEWFRLCVDPQDGEVKLRENLTSLDTAQIDHAIERARDFLQRNYTQIVAACGLSDRCDREAGIFRHGVDVRSDDAPADGVQLDDDAPTDDAWDDDADSVEFMSLFA